MVDDSTLSSGLSGKRGQSGGWQTLSAWGMADFLLGWIPQPQYYSALSQVIRCCEDHFYNITSSILSFYSLDASVTPSTLGNNPKLPPTINKHPLGL